ncbi:putative hydroxymethylpyrimidine transporter CytX [Limosilactobacillus caccae]|uniref:putative hydroxymethylpyrimidine transporter CytX n=1 Tax=Limosilactobacillus caccae TaxID=1926284 RepID=UPI0009713FAD|nr:putative hydroxymethylpyrimidine transporter CytX [Limosilactobacillus caccae]
MKKETSVFANGLIWFGAAISIAEIITGTYIAPLGFTKGLLAILIGHLIGAALLFFAGYIGASSRQSAMETVKMSFGHNGSKFFAGLNVAQLCGWTSIMIFDGAIAAKSIFQLAHWQWCLIIAALISLWILVGLTHLEKINLVAIALLLLLTIWLSTIIFTGHNPQATPSPSLTFGEAVELAIAMPLSWLPLISDYTSKAAAPRLTTFTSVAAYTIGSCWMYIIGMGATLLTGQDNIATVMRHAGMGVAGLLIIVFSTVTTTFMDAYSAGVSSLTVWRKLNKTHVALVATIIGFITASLFPMDNISPFLYIIDSVFTPMIAIQLTDFFILRKTPAHHQVEWLNMAIWLIGFIVYRLLMLVDTPIGNTIPDIIIVIIITLICHKIKQK